MMAAARGDVMAMWSQASWLPLGPELARYGTKNLWKMSSEKMWIPCHQSGKFKKMVDEKKHASEQLEADLQSVQDDLLRLKLNGAQHQSSGSATDANKHQHPSSGSHVNDEPSDCRLVSSISRSSKPPTFSSRHRNGGLNASASLEDELLSTRRFVRQATAFAEHVSKQQQLASSHHRHSDYESAGIVRPPAFSQRRQHANGVSSGGGCRAVMNSGMAAYRGDVGHLQNGYSMPSCPACRRDPRILRTANEKATL
ncbi:unnamed protein product [Notodromas monacha]|uniref:Uncharacterized protein n=1 Tax=Notodromas monacha TaxID=399045 RepID=A0A7R9BDM2_9CRUS|nr:unnamed protein product [Notodromas monacha]CAG0913450.1 unnamed protein product [Notodromas monacha]